MTMEFRSFRVRLPSGVRYWTVIDGSYRPVVVADDFLLTCRLGQDRAENTTQAYATAIGLFFQWCSDSGMGWPDSAPQLGRFVFWLQHYDPHQTRRPGDETPVRGARRVNAILAAVREFIKHAVVVGAVPNTILNALYDVVRDWDLPAEVRGERDVRYRERPRHRLSEPEQPIDDATSEEILALLRACHNPRDRFIVIALWRMGTRRGELTGVRREDAHFVPDAMMLGCGVKGPHLHVVRRMNPNGAIAKSRRPRAIPADWLVVQAFDQYCMARDACVEAAGCDFLLVNLYQQPLGRPMRPQALNELLERLSLRAGLSRTIHPHQLRHNFANAVSASGGTLDEIRDLLGHASLSSSEVYLHPSPDRLRAAVDRVTLPRLAREDE